MKLFEGKTPAERNKLIIAIALGVLAFASLSYMLFGGDSPSPKRQANANSNTATRTTAGEIPERTSATIQTPAQIREETESLSPARPIIYTRTSYAVPEAGRNIFAFYVKPPPVVKPTVIPQPSPTPPPPQVLASVSPSSVFARTGDFTIEVSGDKFTPQTAITVDNNPLPTRFINAQQLSATVPGALISNDGARQIKLSTPDGSLYSNVMPLMVTPPPIPNFLYIGIIGKPHYNDTAVLKDKGNPKELLNVQRGDVIGSRFRVTSISEREIVLTDTALRIKHTLPFVEEKGGGQTTGGRNAGQRTPLESESGIPGIPNIPRYQTPGTPGMPGRIEQPESDNDEEAGEIAPGIPGKPARP